MNFREALCHAVEQLRASGSEDPYDRAAAKSLEQKAERLRARTEAPAVWEHRCYCGERRAADRLICVECHRAIPAALMLTYHTGSHREQQTARRSIITICQTRIGTAEAERRAA